MEHISEDDTHICGFTIVLTDSKIGLDVIAWLYFSDIKVYINLLVRTRYCLSNNSRRVDDPHNLRPKANRLNKNWQRGYDEVSCEGDVYLMFLEEFLSSCKFSTILCFTVT